LGQNQRIEVPIASERQRQTYYGAFDYSSKQFYVQAHKAGNTENTIAFLKYLRSLDEQARLLIIWDGASYHRSHQLRQVLAEANAGLPPEHWKIECICFAPHAPEQNPVEDTGCKPSSSFVSSSWCASPLLWSSTYLSL